MLNMTCEDDESYVTAECGKINWRNMAYLISSWAEQENERIENDVDNHDFQFGESFFKIVLNLNKTFWNLNFFNFFIKNNFFL